METNKIRKTYWVYPTRACNMLCHYCYQQGNRDPQNILNFMDLKTAVDVCNFIERDEPNREKQVQFFGGEPLLAWNTIIYFVSRLINKVKYSITTNGKLLDEGKLAFLKSNNFGLALSIDGPPGVSNKTRPGSGEVPIDLVAEYFPNAQIIMTLSPENIEDAYRSTLWFIEKGFRSIAHNTMIEKPWPKFHEKIYHLFFNDLADWYINNPGKAGFMFIGYAEKAVNNSSSRFEKNICGSNRNLLSIDINGDIYPCQDMVTCDIKKKYKIGNVISGYIPPESIPLSAMNFPDREECQVCWFFHQCVGGCGPKNLLVCGDRYSPIMNGCIFHKIQIQEGMRALLNTGRLELRRKQNVQR